MKQVFIGGSKTINELNDTEIKLLDELMRDEVQILIGDCFGADKLVQEYLYKNNYEKVYVYTSVNEPRVNIGLWSVCWCKTDNSTGYLKHMQKDLRMAKSCDYGIMFWDEESKGTFVNLLELVKMGKPATLVLHESGDCEKIETFDDLRKYADAENKGDEYRFYDYISGDKYGGMFRTFLHSEDMGLYMLDKWIHKWNVAYMISNCPISLSVKRYWLEELSNHECLLNEFLNIAIQAADVKEMNEDLAENYKMSFLCYAGKYRNAINNLNLEPGELFFLSRCWFDRKQMHDNSETICPFNSIDDVYKFIDKDTEEVNEINYQRDKRGKYPLYWYELEKWVPNKLGSYDKTYSYILKGSDVDYYEDSEQNSFQDNMSLNLPMPFKPGDIVKIDCTPFSPALLAVILEAGDNRDGCYPTALVKKPDIGWDIAGVKSGHVLYGIDSILSTHYRIEKYNRKLPKDLELLKTVSNYIDGSEARGNFIWDTSGTGKKLETAIIEKIKKVDKKEKRNEV